MRPAGEIFEIEVFADGLSLHLRPAQDKLESSNGSYPGSSYFSSNAELGCKHEHGNEQCFQCPLDVQKGLKFIYIAFLHIAQRIASPTHVLCLGSAYKIRRIYAKTRFMSYANLRRGTLFRYATPLRQPKTLGHAGYIRENLHGFHTGIRRGQTRIIIQNPLMTLQSLEEVR